MEVQVETTLIHRVHGNHNNGPRMITDGQPNAAEVQESYFIQHP